MTFDELADELAYDAEQLWLWWLGPFPTDRRRLAWRRAQAAELAAVIEPRWARIAGDPAELERVRRQALRAIERVIHDTVRILAARSTSCHRVAGGAS
jgi:hypothetical protein